MKQAAASINADAPFACCSYSAPLANGEMGEKTLGGYVWDVIQSFPCCLSQACPLCNHFSVKWWEGGRES